MANLKDIRNRIQSTKNTQQITRAMKMVSAAKLRRAQLAVQNLRPFARQILSTIADLAGNDRVSHPLLSAAAVPGAPARDLVVVLTSDRGLAGGFNNNINRAAWKFHGERAGAGAMDFIFVGRKGANFFRARGVEGVETILNLAREVNFKLAEGVAGRLMAGFVGGGYSSIYLVYNEFKSAISQEVVVERLLPVDLAAAARPLEGGSSPPARDMIFEPAPEAIVDDLLKKHFSVQVYRAMCESVAAEHGARMAAMENATKNAGEMIRSMTLTYNKLRQAGITTELIEITSGAEALKG